MTTPRTEIERQIKDFLVEMSGASPKALRPETRLGHDLGIDGDDGDEIMEAFSAKFVVDMSEFEFERYFGPERAFNPLLWLYWRLFQPHSLHLEPITIDDLVEAAQRGKWQR